MSIDTLKDRLPDYARDIKLNLSSLASEQLLTPQQRAGKKKSVPLVKDPVCGTYVVRERALTLDAGKQTQYFCSERCRDEYTRGARAIAR